MDYGIIVDLETTGADFDRDKIIEIGIVEFAVEEGHEPSIVNMYGALQDPGEPLSEEIKKLTGIDDVYLQGKQIDWKLVSDYFSRASIAIAHNAVFDRTFLMQRSELDLSSVHWGCSLRFIDWKAHGFKTRALNYLAADHGFVNPFAHRALFDCATTFRIVAPRLKELIECSFMREYRVFATGAAFDTKDLLKANGYRWDPEKRVWTKDVFENRLHEEREFLRLNVYRGADLHQEEEISLNMNRLS
jgi:DNA polymerase-3 subunit epsilon